MWRSLRAKLVRTMVAMVLALASGTVLVVAVMNFVSARATLSTIESHLEATLHRKGVEVVSNQALALRDLVADNAFGDVSRLIERTVNGDKELSYGLFLGEDGKAWGFSSRLTTATGQKPETVGQLGVEFGPTTGSGVRTTKKRVLGEDVVEFGMRVVDDAATPLGTLWYALSENTLLTALADARAASRRALVTTIAMLLVLGGGAIGVGILFSRRAASRITRPLGELTTAAKAIGQGNRDIRVSIDSRDELETLGTAFNQMAAEIHEYTVRLEAMNRGLEAKVDERTRALAERNRDMRLVLDNVDQGLLTLSPEGRIAPERSAVVERWFGPAATDATFGDYLAPIDPIFAETFALAYEALWADALPRELCLQQLPRRLRHGEAYFQCTYLPLGQGAALEGLLVVIDDITEQLRAARQDAERAEILAMFEASSRDRAGFVAFVDETNDLFARLPAADLPTQKRLIHTVKGNSGIFDLSVLGGLCHQLEDHLNEHPVQLTAAELAPLAQRWAVLQTTLTTFLGGDRGRNVIELPSDDVERLEKEARLGLSSARVAERLAGWRLEPAERPLGRMGNHAKALATRVGKGPLDVVIDGGGVRLPPRAWASVWSDLVHVVRNAVDHGVESPAERLRAGKINPPTLRLSARRLEASVEIQIEDDGGGIDLVAVKRAAQRRGLPCATQDQVVGAVFAPGLTTSEKVTSTSGRGIGLTAVRARVEAMGGTVTVRTSPGKGTCFSFNFPSPLDAARETEGRRQDEGGHDAVA